MTTYLEPSPDTSYESVTTLSRFPASNIGSSLLAIIESAMDGVIVIDATRHIVLVNQKAENMFGYSARQLLDRPLDLILPPRISAEQRRRIERVAAIRKSGRRTRVGLRAVRADGEEFQISANITRITMHGETFLAVILRDTKAQTGNIRRQRLHRIPDLRKLAVSSQQANEIEKRRFSKELYDDIGQRLSVIKLDLDWLENSLPETNERVPARVAQMQGMLDKVITLTKSMASTLRPPLLDDFGLIPAVEWMTENFRKKNGIACVLEHRGIKTKLGDPIESAVFRVIQEGLLNIERHAHATYVKVILEYAADTLSVLIQDNGVGMAPDAENKLGCYGLIAMQERIFVLGGTISVTNIKPQGMAIHAMIPIDPLPLQQDTKL